MTTAAAVVCEEDDFRNTCTICLIAYDQVVHKPKFLDCHHTFCLQCMKSFTRKRLESIPCPTCRSETSCAIGREKSLTTNNYVILPQPVTSAIVSRLSKVTTIIQSETLFTFSKNSPLQVRGRAIPEFITSFETAYLKTRLLKKLRESGYSKPTSLQERVIPALLARRDVLVCAERLSGKTVAYLVPIIDMLLEEGPRWSAYFQTPVALIIVPDNQSAYKILEQARNLLHDGNIASNLILTITPDQIESVINGTHLINFKIIDFSKVKFVVLDEARPIESDLEKLLKLPSMPDDRQILIFSSTFPNDVPQLATKFLKNDFILVANNWTLDGINPHLNLILYEAEFVLNGVTYLPSNAIQSFLQKLKTNGAFPKTLILVESIKQADLLTRCLHHLLGYSATCIHEELAQHQRDKVLRDFRNNEKQILVSTYDCTDGLDFDGVEYVFYYELPTNKDDYLFTSRRSGRLPVMRHILFFDASMDKEESSEELVQKLLSCSSDIPDFLFRAAYPGMSYNHGSESPDEERRYPVWKRTT